MAKPPQAPEKWYPKGLSDPKAGLGLRRAFDFLYKVNGNMAALAGRLNTFLGTTGPVPSLGATLANVPGYDLLQTGSSKSIGGLQGSIPSDISGGFTPTFASTNIQFAWTNLKIYTPDRAIQPQKYIAVPDGAQNSTGLTAST